MQFGKNLNLENGRKNIPEQKDRIAHEVPPL